MNFFISFEVPRDHVHQNFQIKIPVVNADHAESSDHTTKIGPCRRSGPCRASSFIKISRLEKFLILISKSFDFSKVEKYLDYLR